MAKITWLDQPTYINPEFISKMERLGEFTLYNDFPNEGTALKRLSNTDIAIVEWTPITASIMSRVKRLQYICLVTTSHDYVDLPSIKAKGLKISNCPLYSAQSVAEYIFSGIMYLNRRISASHRLSCQGKKHAYLPFLGSELKGKVFGLIGTGNIGQKVASIAKALQMKVIGCNRHQEEIEEIEILPLEDVLRDSDFVSIQVPFNTETRHMIDSHKLQIMKKTAIVANVSRGGIIEEEALYQQLVQQQLKGALLDDITVAKNNPLYQLDNVLVTTGIAWYTEESRSTNLEEVCNNIEAYLKGDPINLL